METLLSRARLVAMVRDWPWASTYSLPCAIAILILCLAMGREITLMRLCTISCVIPQPLCRRAFRARTRIAQIMLR